MEIGEQSEDERKNNKKYKYNIKNIQKKKNTKITKTALRIKNEKLHVT